MSCNTLLCVDADSWVTRATSCESSTPTNPADVPHSTCKPTFLDS